MKLGTSCGFELYGETHYKKMKEIGYDCHDYNMPSTETPLYTLPLSEAEEILRQQKARADEAGIEIWQVHGPWRFPPQDLTEEDRKERMEKMKRSIHMTSILGCKRWVIHPIMPYGIDDLLTGNEDKTYKINIDFMRELLDFAKKYDITICYENMPFLNFSLSKPVDILRVINEINDSNFKMCFDTGHVGTFELNVGDEVRRAGDKIEAFHIHDTKCNLDLHLLPFYGIIDWTDFSQALKDINFNGCFSLETSPPHTLPLDIYWEQHVSLVNIAKAIIKGNF
ncbi:MAG: sugar phosphate isomerase/epimerase [Clostridia bacterium]|nr:sugar phosphate isomerase/epimerase [Clostridia bacterium]